MAEFDRVAEGGSAAVRSGRPAQRTESRSSANADDPRRLLGGRARVLHLEEHVDSRGALLPLDFARLPLAPCRAFVVHGTPSGARRGGHAHRRESQLLVRLSGRIVVELRYQGEEASVELASSDRGLLVGPGVWARQTYYGPDARLLVLSDHPYDPDAYAYADDA